MPPIRNMPDGRSPRAGRWTAGCCAWTSVSRLRQAAAGPVRDAVVAPGLGVRTALPLSVAAGEDDVGLEGEDAKGTSPAEIEPLMLLLDRVWDALAFEARWQSVRQRLEARKALERFLTWHTEDRGRTLVASEHEFKVSLTVGDREVVLRGSMDRVEIDTDGLVHVIDLKTGKNPPSGPKVAEHPQLGVYQVAVREGAVAALAGLEDAVSGGAELVQLRAGSKDGRPKVQNQAPLAVHDDGTTDVDRHLAAAVATMTAEEFPPTPGEACKLLPVQGFLPGA